MFVDMGPLAVLVKMLEWAQIVSIFIFPLAAFLAVVILFYIWRELRRIARHLSASKKSAPRRREPRELIE